MLLCGDAEIDQRPRVAQLSGREESTARGAYSEPTSRRTAYLPAGTPSSPSAAHLASQRSAVNLLRSCRKADEASPDRCPSCPSPGCRREFPVPLPPWKLTPAGKVPRSVTAGDGLPVAATMNTVASPTVKVVVSADLKLAAAPTTNVNVCEALKAEPFRL